MAKIVFVLGAGASRAAGGPLMSDFIDLAEALLAANRLSTEDRAHFEAVFAAVGELGRVHTKAALNTDNIEEVFAALEMAELLQLHLQPVDLVAAMRAVIARTIEDRIVYPIIQRGNQANVTPPSAYGAFGDWLGKRLAAGGDLAVLSFNYDCALDYALWYHNVPLNYCLQDEYDEPKGLKLLKLHGSLNWLRDEAGIVPVHLERIRRPIQEYLRRRLKTGGKETRVEFSALALASPAGSRVPAPSIAVVPPVWSKLEYYRPMAAVWGAAARALEGAEYIIVSGYSLPETDQFFRHLFALGTRGSSRIKGVFVFDPAGPEVADRFRGLLGAQTLRRFHFEPMMFESLVGWIENNNLGIPLRAT